MPIPDNIDKQILDILRLDCRTPYRDIAKKLDISSTAVKNRIDQLIEAGVIRGYSVQLSLDMVGSDLFFAWLNTDGEEEQEAFISELGQIQGIIQISPIFGGGYLVYGEYVGTQGLSRVSTALKKLEPVKSVEVHLISTSPGKSVTLTNTQLKILSSLLNNARKPVKEIASETGFTARKVKKVIEGFKESHAVHFMLRWSIGAGDRLAFLLVIRWDEKQIAGEELVVRLFDEFSEIFWNYLLSATDALMLIAGVVDSLKEVEIISEKIRTHTPAKRVDVFVSGPSRNFETIRRLRLEEMISKAGL